MAENNVLLETIQLTQNASSVTFDNIPQTGYTDLKVVMSARTDANDGSSGQWAYVNFNGATTNNSVRVLYGTGSGTGSLSASSPTPYGAYVEPSNFTASTFSNSEVYIPNYTSSNSKSYSIDSVTENNATGAYSNLTAGLWSSTAAITSVVLTPAGGSFVSGSTFSLYGVAATGTEPAIAPKATGGNIVANDGTYWYHAFLTSGTFTPQTELTSCDALVVAGGGGGGSNYGSGGGAGGLLQFTSQSFLTPQTVIIGAGGASATSPGRGTNGNNSTLGSLTATIGGGAGGGNASGQYNGGNGGSGGGAGGITSSGVGGSGTAGQGYAGASQSSAGDSRGGGGAGAAGSGTNAGIGATSAMINAMGLATTTGELSGGNRYFAGGGLGYSAGTRGLGGGGASAGSGWANTGGGSGGDCLAGNSGGSGIVIIRYPMA